MRASIIAFGLAGSAIASYAPAPPAYGAETTEVPSYPVETYPATYESSTVPEAPKYETTSSYEAPKYEATPTHEAPKYETTPVKYATSSEAPKYPKSETVKTYETVYTTYCPQPTTYVHESKTWIVTSATTLTIPATYTTKVPVYEHSTIIESKSVPYSPQQPSAPVYSPEKPVAPSAPAAPYYPVGKNTTQPIGTGAPPAATKPATYTGAAVANVAGGAFAGVAALAAFFL